MVEIACGAITILDSEQVDLDENLIERRWKTRQKGFPAIAGLLYFVGAAN